MSGGRGTLLKNASNIWKDRALVFAADLMMKEYPTLESRTEEAAKSLSEYVSEKFF